MDSETPIWTWHWGQFFVYSIGCFVAAMALGCMGVPGIIVVAVGTCLGICAVLRHWFETPHVPGNRFVDRKP